MCVIRRAFVIKPNTVEIKHRRIGAHLCRKAALRATKPNSVDRVWAGMVVATAVRTPLFPFSTPITAQARWAAPASPEIAPADPGG